MANFVPLSPEEASFADTEMQADLENDPSSDTISRLGHDATILNISDDRTRARYSFTYLDNGDPRVRFTPAGKEDISLGFDYTSSKAVWNHELRHRGFRLLREQFPEREGFAAQYGEDAALLLFDTPEEQQNEVFDRMHHPESFKNEAGEVIEFEELRDTNVLMVDDRAFMGVMKAAEDLEVSRGAPPRARPKGGQ